MGDGSNSEFVNTERGLLAPLTKEFSSASGHRFFVPVKAGLNACGKREPLAFFQLYLYFVPDLTERSIHCIFPKYVYYCCRQKIEVVSRDDRRMTEECILYPAGIH